jgi:hypothetical protein
MRPAGYGRRFRKSYKQVIWGRCKQIVFMLLLSFAAASARAQETPAQSQQPQASEPVGAQPTSSAEKPLPDIVAMMHDVEQNQRKAEAIEKDYICHSVERQEQTDSGGRVKKTTVLEYDHYWSEGVPVRRLVRKDGKDLSASELAKEDERIRKEVGKAREHRAKAEAEGKPTNARGDELIPVSRLLELGRFTNPRRVQLGARDTIAVDYEGDPSARTRNRAEEVIRDLRGTVWVDENDRMLVRAEGYFANGFKIGAGLLVSIQKGTRFEMNQKKVNEEVWSPAHIEAHGAARALLFFNFTGSIRADYSDYRKLRTSSVVLPGATKVDDSEAPHAATP